MASPEKYLKSLNDKSPIKLEKSLPLNFVVIFPDKELFSINVKLSLPIFALIISVEKSKSINSFE